MELERRALYNLLRMNWISNPELEVEQWQVEDYRGYTEEELFESLSELEINLDLPTFNAYCEEFDSPEELSDSIVDDVDDPSYADQVYLLVFELWRRHGHDKPCLSVFCDELDHQINLYDHDLLENTEDIQDILSNFQQILDENVDEGGEPKEVFASITTGCANDIESFLYDYISEEIDDENFSYASDLADAFCDYVTDVKWFDFLKARVAAVADPDEAERLLESLVEESEDFRDLEFNLELLSFMVEEGEKPQFTKLVEHSLPLIQVEADLQDLMNLCAEYYERLDITKEDQAIHQLLEGRKGKKPEESVDHQDPSISELSRILELSYPPSS